ncbi:MAG: hypothetical protein A4E57_04069 [Syntrophorhabdaceae bacterium PtaU1.Bin034]|nr:MAG: hypothetical protein A4E57_04069 [Syntrophorhabdaceae bacterium PtaU1.Bin034]
MSRGVYGPKIRDDLIPYIYRLARHWGRPMTHVVNYMLDAIVTQLKENGLYKTIEEEERAVKEISDHIVKLVKSKKKEERERIIELFRNLA